MKLGIGLPQMMPDGLDRKLFLEWARLADSAGFHALGTLDRPNYDSWEVLTSLAAAGRGHRAGAPRHLHPPGADPRRAGGRQAGRYHRQLSDGRLDLGLGIGNRTDDYEAMGAEWGRRGPRLRRQVERMRALWTAARASDHDTGINGPAPVQEGGIPIIIGAAHEAAVKRAIEVGDGFIFGGGVPPAAVAEQLPGIRARAAEQGKPGFKFYKIQYCAIGDPDQVLEQARHDLLRYYRNPNMPFEKIVVRGDAGVLAENARQFADAGLDLLIYLPAVLDLKQLEAIASGVLPAYRRGGQFTLGVIPGYIWQRSAVACRHARYHSVQGGGSAPCYPAKPLPGGSWIPVPGNSERATFGR
jgi:hypothetical protein